MAPQRTIQAALRRKGDVADGDNDEQWFYMDKFRVQHGPFNVNELGDLYAMGNMEQNTLVWSTVMDVWRPLTDSPLWETEDQKAENAKAAKKAKSNKPSRLPACPQWGDLNCRSPILRLLLCILALVATIVILTFALQDELGLSGGGGGGGGGGVKGVQAGSGGGQNGRRGSRVRTDGAFAELSPVGQITAGGSADYGGTNSPSVGLFSVICSTQAAFAALSDVGTISAWGSPDFGGVSPPSGDDFVAIYSTRCCFAALKETGELVPWGRLADAAFGPWFDNLKLVAGRPTAPPAPPSAPQVNPIIYVSAMGGAVVALLLLAIAIVAWRQWKQSQLGPRQMEPVKGRPLPPPPEVKV